MPDIHFECPGCNQPLDAPEELANQLIECPTCKETIEVPIRTHPLKPQASAPPRPPPNSPLQSRVAVSQPVLRSGDIICPNPNCGYTGPTRKQARGSLIMGLILCCFFLIPGLLYFMLMSGYRYYCPKCSLQVGNDN